MQLQQLQERLMVTDRGLREEGEVDEDVLVGSAISLRTTQAWFGSDIAYGRDRRSFGERRSATGEIAVVSALASASRRSVLM